MKAPIAVLLSGRGSNLQALLNAADAPFEIKLVISNRPDALGLSIARAAGIEALALDHRLFKTREEHEREIHALLAAAQVEWVALAGYMRRLTPFLVSAWAGRMVNIHPSLLPAFPGLDTHARALAAGCTLAGASVHYVTEALDSGPIIGQAAVPVLADDTPQTLAARVLAAEHRLYPACLSVLCGAPAPAPSFADGISLNIRANRQ